MPNAYEVQNFIANVKIVENALMVTENGNFSHIYNTRCPTQYTKELMQKLSSSWAINW